MISKILYPVTLTAALFTFCNASYAQLSQFPKIATYANEIGLPTEELTGASDLEIIFNDGELELKNREESRIRYHSDNNSITWSEGYSGTGGEESWYQKYYLLEDANEPTVLVLKEKATSERSYTVYREDVYNNAQDLAEEYGGSPDDYMEEGELMADKDYGLSDFNSQPHNYTELKVELTVYKKTNGKWQTISDVLPSDFADVCEKYYPLNRITKGEFLNLNAGYTVKFVEANKKIFDNWCNLDQYEVKQGEISIGCEDNPMFVLAWNGKKFVYDKKPSKTPKFKRLACESLDLTGNTIYTFKGNIGEGNAVNMKVRFKEIGRSNGIPKVKMTGDYGYTKGSGRMDIEGEFDLYLGEGIRFYRMKDGVKREEFVCFFEGCTMEGWWQHTKRMKSIHNFELTLE